MTLLDRSPFREVLQELERRADEADAALRREFFALPEVERARILASAGEDYRAFYGGVAKDLFLAAPASTRRLLYVLARAARAETVVEFGTSFGVSTLWLAAAVHDNGGGRVLTTELEPGKAARSRDTFARAGVGSLVELREGDALETLARDLPSTIDLVVLDGAKPLYVPVLELLRKALRPGAVVVADNVDDAPAFAAFLGERKNGFELAPVRDDLVVAAFLGAR